MAGICVAGSIVGAAAQNADAELQDFFRRYLDGRFERQPVAGSSLGDHRFDHLLDDVSPVARAGWRLHDVETLIALEESINYDALSRAGQIDYEILKQDLEKRIWLSENTRPFEEDPRAYGSYITGSVYSLLTHSTLPMEENISNAIARMKEIPRVVESARECLTRPPQSILETAIRQNLGAISFYRDGMFQFAGETPQMEALKVEAAKIVAALEAHQQFLEGELMERADGEWRLGKERFSKKLELVLDAGMTADEVLADAEAEFARVRSDMYVVARQAWSGFFPGETLPPDDASGRRETIDRVCHAINQFHGTPDELLGDAIETVDSIKRFITERDILRLPEPDRCELIEMPEFHRGNSLAYMDSAAPLDPDARSFYAISPPPADWSEDRVKSFLEEYNHYMLQILTIHEAYPGHYVQLEYSNRSPSLIRKILGSGVFIEGWAVYTEQTMLDEGYGDGDLALRMMQLKFYLRAVANAILDHKMHCTNMTDEEALSFMIDDAFQAEGEARLKLIRAKQSSVQLSTYFVGRMAHYRLRQQIQRELGEDFDLGRYHEAVLSHGSVPVKYLPELVRARLAEPR